MKKKNIIRSDSDRHLANPSDLLSTVMTSDADITEAYSDRADGRYSAKNRNYPGGSRTMQMTYVPPVNRKYEHAEDIKAMRKEGIPVEEIARKMGISTSYVYQILREM